MRVAIFGSGKVDSDHPVWKMAFNLGVRLFDNANHEIVNGGYDGVMAASAYGITSQYKPSRPRECRSGRALGITLAIKPQGNQYLSETKTTNTPLPKDQVWQRLEWIKGFSTIYVFLPGSESTVFELMSVLNDRSMGKKLGLTGPVKPIIALRCPKECEQEFSLYALVTNKLGYDNVPSFQIAQDATHGARLVNWISSGKQLPGPPQRCLHQN